VMLPLLPPIRVEITRWGERFGDVVFGTGDDPLVSEALRDAFTAAGLIGLSEFIPVEVTKVVVKRGARLPRPVYSLARVARGRAMIDDVRSGIERDAEPSCSECGSGPLKRAKAVILERSTWSGEDVFYSRGLPGTILTSERFYDLAQAEQFANCQLVPANEYAFDLYPWESADQKST
jgi:hypothetical protein